MLTFHRKNNFLVYHKSRARVDGRRGDHLFAVRAVAYFAFTENGHESLLVPQRSHLSDACELGYAL